MPDSAILNPLCCTACDGQKPPCSYIVRAECEVICGTFVDIGGSTRPRYVLKPDMVMRPLCSFTDSCKFVSSKYDATNSPPFPGYFVELYQDACTWSQRQGGQYIGGLPVTWDPAVALTHVGWRLDIGTSPVAMTHVDGGWTYRQYAPATWNCYAANTLHLVPSPSNCAGLPPFVCITPGFKTSYPPNPCCQGNVCFSLTLPHIVSADGFSIHIQAQTVTLLTNGAATRDMLGVSRCNYGSWIHSYGLANGITQASLYILSPMDTGNPSAATLQILYNYGGACASGFTSFDDLENLPRATYRCDNFKCATGGTFALQTGDSAFPATLTLTPKTCVNSENNDYGPCGKQCYGESFCFDDPMQHYYQSEAMRCQCQDEWCSRVDGGIMLFNSAGASYSAGRCVVSLGGPFTKTSNSVNGSPGGYVRELCCTVGGGHTVCVRIYCDGTWQSEWYCDGTYVSTVPIQDVAQCPFKGRCLAPAMPGCDIVSGCLGLNIEPSCSAPSCCANADEPATCHVTFTSSCAGLNGTTVTLTRTASHTWLLNTGFGIIYNLSCSVGVWTLRVTYSPFPACSVTMTSTNPVCTPFISGTFSGGVFACSGGLCVPGDTVSAVLSV